MILKVCVLFSIAILNFAVAEVVVVSSCPNIPSDKCTLGEVHIDPCKETPKACKFKKGKDASIAFDFVPKFTATKLKSAVYWANGSDIEPEFGDMDRDACKYSTCPTQADQGQSYSYRLHIGKKLPSGTYTIKWKIWNEENENEVCCFLTNIALRR